MVFSRTSSPTSFGILAMSSGKNVSSLLFRSIRRKLVSSSNEIGNSGEKRQMPHRPEQCGPIPFFRRTCHSTRPQFEAHPFGAFRPLELSVKHSPPSEPEIASEMTACNVLAFSFHDMKATACANVLMMPMKNSQSRVKCTGSASKSGGQYVPELPRLCCQVCLRLYSEAWRAPAIASRLLRSQVCYYGGGVPSASCACERPPRGPAASTMRFNRQLQFVQRSPTLT